LYTTILKDKAMRHTALDIAWDSVYGDDNLQALFARLESVRPVFKPLTPVSLASVSLIPVSLTPRLAASSPVPHCPAGRRAPSGSAQQTLFAVLDRMGARHRAASGESALKRALEDAGKQ